MSAAAPLTADVVIVTWRSGERVLGCLERLTGQIAPERVVVVDNASDDGTVDGVYARFPDVRVLELDTNIGFGSAVNRGAALGDGDAIVLVNDDVEVDEGCVAELLTPLARDPGCGMVAGLTLMPGRQLVDGFGIELDVTLAAYNRLRGRGPEATAGRLAMPSGGLAAYRRSAFEQAGGFDERLFAYGEDVDLGLRLRLAGWGAAAASGARGVHEGGATVGVGSPRQRRMFGFARGYLLRRYGVLASRAAPRALLFETLLVAWGVLAHRTTVPLRARVAGWRAARGQRSPIPAAALDRSIGAGEALRRLRRGQEAA
jgi:GT2 family glycosyltransferase